MMRTSLKVDTDLENGFWNAAGGTAGVADEADDSALLLAPEETASGALACGQTLT
jgi:hypothetical protein